MNTAERFARLFRGFETRFGRYVISGQEPSGKLTGQAKTIHQAVTLEDYANHLDKKAGVGVIPLTEDNQVHFAALDIDVYPISHGELARKLEDLPVLVTRSKSGGAHVWLFCETGAPASIVRDVLKHWASELGYGGCEVFPKQSERAGPEDVGNWINLPYFGDTRTGLGVVKKDNTKQTQDLDLETWLAVAEDCAKFVTTAWLMEHAPKVRAQRDTSGDAPDWQDGPPCLQRLLVGNPNAKKEALRSPQLSEGGRNTAFFNAATYLLRKYGNADAVREVLVEVNGTNNFGLKVREIETAIKSAQKDYGYQCQTSPLCDFCSRGLCLKRRYGVGSNTKDLSVEISGMTVIETDPVTYAFNVDGIRVRVEGDTLLAQSQLRRVLLDASGKVFPPMKEDAFYDLIQGYVNSGTRIEGPPGADQDSELHEHVAAFLQRKKSTKPERYHTGSVYWDDEEKYAYFKFQEASKWLVQNRVKATRNDLTFFLQNIGAEHTNTSLGGRSARPWRIPLRTFFTDETT